MACSCVRPVAEGDPVALRSDAVPHEALAAKIPTGKETKRLLDNGFATWGDLYSSRQLEVLAKGLKAVALLGCAPAIRDRLAFSLLGAAEMGEGVRIFIGSENRLFSLSGSSIIVTPFRNAEEKIVGVMGIIGPTRMNYARIIPMVDYTAKAIGRLLT